MAATFKRLERLLSIGAALVIIIGGISGLVFWLWPPAATQPVGQTTTPANPPSAEPGGTGQPAAPSRTVAYQEDFKGHAGSELPPGWKSDAGGQVVKVDESRFAFQPQKDGATTVTVTGLDLRDDFFLETEIEVVWGHLLTVTLLGRGTGESLPMTVNGTTSTDVTLPGGALRNLKQATGGTRATLRLEREGVIYRVKLNGEVAHARRLKTFGDFDGLRFVLSGVKSRIYSVRAGPMTFPPPPGPDGLSAAERFRRDFAEDFKTAVVGGLPVGWDGDDSVGVRADGKPRLEAGAAGDQRVTTTPLAITGDFFAEVEVQVPSGHPLDVVLKGAGGADDLTVRVVGTSSTDVTLAGVLKNLPVATGDLPAKLRIQRKAGVYLVSLNGQKAHANKLPELGDFAGLQLSFVGGSSSTKIFAVRVGPLSP